MKPRVFSSVVSLRWREAQAIEDLQPELFAADRAFADAARPIATVARSLEEREAVVKLYADCRSRSAQMHRKWSDDLIREIEALRRDQRDVRRHNVLSGLEDRRTHQVTFCGVLDPLWSVRVTGPVCPLRDAWVVPPSSFGA